MRRRTLISLLIAAGLLAAAAPAPADAAVKSFRLRSGPYSMADFNVLFPKEAVPAPHVDGYLTDMNVRLVDRRGRPVTIRDVMLHHVLFKNTAVHGLARGNCPQSNGESFFGTGEEHQTLNLPAGYGYRVRAGDDWRMNVMLMSHSQATERVYVEYWGRIVTGRRLKTVRPFWLSAHGCSANPSWGVYGGGGPNSIHTRQRTWRIPIGGRIVAAGGHLHGGAVDMTVRQERCNRQIFDHKPLFGKPDHIYYRARPILHEPGPIDTRWFTSRTGIRINPGERLKLTAKYDNSVPHTRVMAVSHVYVHPEKGRERRCSPIPRDAHETRRVPTSRGREKSPLVSVPLNAIDSRGRVHEIERPPSPFQTFGRRAQVSIRDFGFHPANIRIQEGGLVTWNFGDIAPHNVTFAEGPRLVSAPTLTRGAKRSSSFEVPGTYKLFCYLHPVTMHQVVEVLPNARDEGGDAAPVDGAPPAAEPIAPTEPGVPPPATPGEEPDPAGPSAIG